VPEFFRREDLGESFGARRPPAESEQVTDALVDVPPLLGGDVGLAVELGDLTDKAIVPVALEEQRLGAIAFHRVPSPSFARIRHPVGSFATCSETGSQSRNPFVRFLNALAGL